MVRHFLFQRNYTEGREWDPLQPPADAFRDCVYLGKVLAEFGRQLDEQAGRQTGSRDVHCYLTWHADTLPEYGPHVVAVLVGEECGLIPRYSRHVGMVARIMSRFPFLGVRRWWPVNKLSLVLAAKYLRNWLQHAYSWWRFHRPPAAWPKPVRKRALIVHIPWGSGSLAEVPMKTISERTANYIFSGQIEQGGLPKRLSRGSLVAALHALEKKHPQLATSDSIKVHAVTTANLTDWDSYAERMMNAKVCLAPRGSVADTWRYFEGMKSGCVVITNPLPEEWYYRGAPVIQLDDWKELEDTLLPLLANETRMEELHRETLAYWHTVCGEEAVGRYMATRWLEGKSPPVA